MNYNILQKVGEPVKHGIRNSRITEFCRISKKNSSKILHYAGFKVYLNYSPFNKNTNREGRAAVKQPLVTARAIF